MSGDHGIGLPYLIFITSGYTNGLCNNELKPDFRVSWSEICIICLVDLLVVGVSMLFSPVD